MRKLNPTIHSFTSLSSRFATLSRGLFLYVLLVPGIGAILNANGEYEPTDDTGPHNPLEPKSVPDESMTLVLIAFGITAAIGFNRFLKSRKRS